VWRQWSGTPTAATSLPLHDRGYSTAAKSLPLCHCRYTTSCVAAMV